jgi:hypothetical protein
VVERVDVRLERSWYESHHHFWLLARCDDGWVESYEIVFQGGSMVIGAIGLHPGGQPGDKGSHPVNVPFEFCGWYPNGGLTTTRLHEMSVVWALERAEEEVSAYRTLSLPLDTIVMGVATVLRDTLAREVREAEIAERLRAANRGNLVTLNKAKTFFKDELMGLGVKPGTESHRAALLHFEDGFIASIEDRQDTFIALIPDPDHELLSLPRRQISGPPSAMSEDDWVDFAVLYHDECEHHPRRPIAALAERLGMNKNAVRSRRDYLAEKGYIESLGQGKPGCRLGQRSLAVLAHREETS